MRLRPKASPQGAGYDGGDEPRPRRQSITPTYDSRETGPRYNVSTWIGNRPVEFRKPIEDPFVSAGVYIGWRDLLRGLLGGRLYVGFGVDADTDLVNDVLELDANTLVPNSTRQAEFRAEINEALGRME